MKRLLIIVALALAFIISTGCSTTRKATTTTAEVQISTTTESEKHNASTTDQAVSISTTVNDITSAVIEFTKTEYFDGTTSTDTTTRHTTEATKPRDRESTEPPNAGVKSITTGRIMLNGDKTETTQTDIATEQTASDNSVVKENSTTDSNIETTYEEKPKRGLIYYVGAITVSLIIIAAIVFVIIVVRRHRNNQSRKGIL